MHNDTDLPGLAQRRSSTQANATDTDIVIGLVNIMPPPAMQATERHFNTLLRNTIPARGVRIQRYTLHDDTGISHRHADAGHEGIGALLNSSLDGLIVTGTEPRAAAMTDEPLWDRLTTLVDWAAENTISTIWSCFSAHAAVFQLDRIARQPLPGKISGVFECAKFAEHAVTSRMPERFLVPHSRHNGLDENKLRNAGYTILSGSPRTGPDMFLKQRENSEFLFLQGHPEYGQSTLLGEYNRDVTRFALGQKQICPQLPENYFPADSANALLALTNQLRADPSSFNRFNWPAVQTDYSNWQTPARLLYEGWLGYIEERKSLRRELPA